MTNTYRPFTGGVPRSIDTFARQYRKFGHQVKIVAPEFDGQEEEKDVIRVPALKHFNGTEFSVQLPVPFFLSEFLAGYKPDIIHSQHPFLLGNTALRLAVSLEIPLIYTFHTFYEHYLHYIPGGENEAMKSFVTTMVAGYANLCDHVIAPSQYVAQELRRRQVVKPIDVIPTGVDVVSIGKGDGPAFRKKHGIPLDAFTVGFVSRLAPEKNMDFLSDAVLEFLASNTNAWFLIAGTGPLENELKNRYKASAVGERIVMVGSLKGRELFDLYHAMDVFAFASQSETQGLVIAEAMAAGVPVVAVQAPGVEDLVQDGVNGRLLAQEDQAAFTQALVWVAALSQDKRAALKSNALKTVQEFSDTTCARKVLALFKTARREAKVLHEHESAWDEFMNIVSAEWNLVANLGRAAGKAWVEGGTEKPKEELT
jgi:glycosyltransferase involved in cell wall biosynthesis